MTQPARGASAAAVLFATLTLARTAAAEKHRVAAVDPDPQLARALEVALLPWGADVTDVTVDHPGAMVNLPAERARAIALQTHADVVMWVSRSGDRAAVWIYDLAADQASLRELGAAPPFDATTAAGVTLSVKALLRFTVVAPPPERFGAPGPTEPTWTFGLCGILALHFGDQVEPEARSEIGAAYWPRWLRHRWGLLLSASYGFLPLPAGDNGFSGTLTDISGRVAVGGHVPLRPWAAFEASIGGTFHLLRLDYVNGTVEPGQMQGPRFERDDFAIGVEPRIAVDFSLLSGFLHLAPWLGMDVLQLLHRFFALPGHTDLVAEDARVTAHAGFRAELALP